LPYARLLSGGLDFLGGPLLPHAADPHTTTNSTKVSSPPTASAAKRLESLTSASDLAAVLGFRLTRLRAFASNKDNRFYREFSIPKRDGASRLISAPDTDLLEVQRRIVRLLEEQYQAPSCVHGFVRGRSQVSNARVHRRSSWVLNVDLADFFHSISFGRVRGMLMAHPYFVPEPVATLIAGLCCAQGRLPQGAPTSPIIANMVAAPLDRTLHGLARKFRCRYTRYADDITFSNSDRRFPSALATRGPDNGTVVGRPLLAAIEAQRFTLNERKSRLQHRSERRTVTGVLVGSKLNLPREYIRRIRAMIHAWATFGEDAAAQTFLDEFDHKARNVASVFRQSVQGRLGYIAAVKGHRDHVYGRLVASGRRLIDDKEDGDAFYSLPLPEDAMVVIEHPLSQGTGFFLEGVGLVSCAHVVADIVEVFDPHRPHLAKSAMTAVVDEILDLAILRTSFKANYVFRPGSFGEVAVGDQIRVLGFPNWNIGRPLSITDSIVFSAQTAPSGYRVYSINHAIYGGNSGGPVLNSRGEVVGVALKGMFQGLKDGDAGSENHFIEIKAVLDLAKRTN
jgi:RNA-directed DNA polymerase